MTSKSKKKYSSLQLPPQAPSAPSPTTESSVKKRLRSAQDNAPPAKNLAEQQPPRKQRRTGAEVQSAREAEALEKQKEKEKKEAAIANVATIEDKQHKEDKARTAAASTKPPARTKTAKQTQNKASKLVAGSDSEESDDLAGKKGNTLE